jgi:Holliday junction resolvase RusA-like endonuclease
MSHETQSKALSVAVRMIPPTTNHMYLQRADRGKALTEEARTFRQLTGWAAKAAAASVGWRYPEGARLELAIELTFPNARNNDLDNRIKAVQDALAPVLHFNDSCIDRIVVVRAPMARNRPLCVMTIRILPARAAGEGEM